VKDYNFEGKRNETNQRVIVIDQSADHSRLRSVLHDWGYSEKEIQQFLTEKNTPRQEVLEKAS
jgi:hypothetical protein